MLDSETKIRINNARDVLVGKVPDPKSQVEQITIALIYKFMDDMDKQSVEMGGKPSFFVGEYEKYSWSSIFNPRLGGHELLGLYADAIATMHQNPNIPQLFRDIFKNAFLPYRDPETLKLFLKTINDFSYEHSEKLGDAFEYLLSVLSSQGDAGQFRTSRHIIKFIVDAIDPRNDEKILDPACGTAGFLIEAYKHIMEANEAKSPKDKMTTDQRKALMNNITGYDISPDMVRLSLANMYLHGFPYPKIHEYDTLTSQDRWNEYADVILANPPFMSPKGGIRPHEKFSISANRSEVLFVDYIAEHLRPGGRAGVIVPEGIIFQSANAYKALRKELIENHYLVAVVSLPAGVFNPYSGVKTSILIMDRQLAKNTENILFAKVEADGFDLGAQRRPIERNDLPQVLCDLKGWMEAVRNGKEEEHKGKGLPPNILLVSKTKLAESGDYNLTADRYRDNGIKAHHKWPMVRLGDLCLIERGASPRPIKDYITDDPDGINWIKIGDGSINSKFIISTKEKITKEGAIKSRSVSKGDFILSNSMSFGHPYILEIDGCIHDGWLLLRLLNENIDKIYLYYVLSTDKSISEFCRLATGGVVNNLNSELVRNVFIPLPPIEVQREIVAEIEGYQKVIDGSRQVVDSWKPKIDIDPSWPQVKLGEVCANIQDTINPNLIEGDVFYIGLENIESNTGLLIGNYNSKYEEIRSTKNRFTKDDVLYGKLRPNLNKVYLAETSGICSTDIYVLRVNDLCIPNFLEYNVRSTLFNNEVLKGLSGSQLPRVNFDFMSNIDIFLPHLETQKKIVEEIENERRIVEGNRELIRIYEAKIKKVIDSVWEE